MSNRSRHRSKKRSRRKFLRSCLPSAKGTAGLVLAGVVVLSGICAVQFGTPETSEADVSIALPQIKRDLTALGSAATAQSGDAESETAAEPARLATAATTQATPVLFPQENSGPLFPDPLAGVASSTSGSDSIEVTRFRPATAERVQANQAAWLTGSIEPVE